MADEFSLSELEAELARRQKSQGRVGFSPSMAAEAFSAGAKRGSYSLMSLPALPVEIGAAVAGKPSITERGAEALGIPKESDFPGYETYFRAGEGAAPGAGLGMVGGIPGMLLGGGLGAISNVAAKALFPESPTGQIAVGLLTPSGAALARGRAGAVPTVPGGIKTSPETGIAETFGQRTGQPGALVAEEKIRRSTEGGKIAAQFDAAQAASVDDFLSRIQQFSAKADLNPKQITEGIYKAYDDYSTKLLNQFKATNKANFDAAKRESGGYAVIPTNNVNATLDRLIAQYDNPEVPGMQAIRNSLIKVKEELKPTPVTYKGIPVSGETPTQISIDRLQQNLAAWGDAAYKGNYATPGKNVAEFADASPGVVKGIARQVLGAFKNDLDEAAESGIAGAGKLKAARDAFGKNLDSLNDYASKPLTRYFDKASPEALVPETVIAKFTELPASQKADAAAVLKQTRPDIWDSLRAQGLNQILEPARVGEAAATGAPKFDIATALKKLGSLDKSDLAWLFPTKEEANLFQTGMKQIQNIQRNAKYTDMSEQEFNQAMRTASEAAGALKGAVGKYGVQTIVDSFKMLIGTADETKLAYMLFNPEGRQMIAEMSKPKPNLDKIKPEVMNTIIGGLTVPALTAREVSAGKPPAPAAPEFSLQELQAELERRQKGQ